jgi:hypothetical protein
MNTKNKLQTFLLICIGTIASILLVGLLTLLVFRGVYTDQNPLANVVSYALDFNRSIYVWLAILVLFYLNISTRWNQISSAIDNFNNKTFPKAVSLVSNALAAILVGTAVSLIIFLSVGFIFWNYSISILNYAELHGPGETISKILSNIYNLGIVADICMWSCYVGVILISFIVIRQKRRKSSRTSAST